MASRTQDEQKVILGALAVFDDDQNGVEPPYACFLINFCSSYRCLGQIDRARLRKLLIGAGTGLNSEHDVDVFMRLLPQGSNFSYADIAKVCAAVTFETF